MSPPLQISASHLLLANNDPPIPGQGKDPCGTGRFDTVIDLSYGCLLETVTNGFVCQPKLSAMTTDGQWQCEEHPANNAIRNPAEVTHADQAYAADLCMVLGRSHGDLASGNLWTKKDATTCELSSTDCLSIDYSGGGPSDKIHPDGSFVTQSFCEKLSYTNSDNEVITCEFERLGQCKEPISIVPEPPGGGSDPCGTGRFDTIADLIYGCAGEKEADGHVCQPKLSAMTTDGQWQCEEQPDNNAIRNPAEVTHADQAYAADLCMLFGRTYGDSTSGNLWTKKDATTCKLDQTGCISIDYSGGGPSDKIDVDNSFVNKVFCEGLSYSDSNNELKTCEYEAQGQCKEPVEVIPEPPGSDSCGTAKFDSVADLIDGCLLEKPSEGNICQPKLSNMTTDGQWQCEEFDPTAPGNNAIRNPEEVTHADQAYAADLCMLLGRAYGDSASGNLWTKKDATTCELDQTGCISIDYSEGGPSDKIDADSSFVNQSFCESLSYRNVDNEVVQCDFEKIGVCQEPPVVPEPPQPPVVNDACGTGKFDTVMDLIEGCLNEMPTLGNACQPKLEAMTTDGQWQCEEFDPNATGKSIIRKPEEVTHADQAYAHDLCMLLGRAYGDAASGNLWTKKDATTCERDSNGCKEVDYSGGEPDPKIDASSSFANASFCEGLTYINGDGDVVQCAFEQSGQCKDNEATVTNDCIGAATKSTLTEQKTTCDQYSTATTRCIVTTNLDSRLSCEELPTADGTLLPGDVAVGTYDDINKAVCSIMGYWYGADGADTWTADAEGTTCLAADVCGKVDWTEAENAIIGTFAFNEAFCKELGHPGGEMGDGVTCEYTEGDTTCSGGMSMLMGAIIASITLVF